MSETREIKGQDIDPDTWLADGRHVEHVGLDADTGNYLLTLGSGERFTVEPDEIIRVRA